eukprot:358847_1
MRVMFGFSQFMKKRYFTRAYDPGWPHRIMVALDMRKGSQEVLKYAIRLSEATKSGLYLFTVPPVIQPDIPLGNATKGEIDTFKDNYQKREEAVMGMMEDARLQACEEMRDEMVFTKIADGGSSPKKEIVKAARDSAIDIIVVGNR